MSAEPFVHDQGYHRFAGRRHPPSGAWLIIARHHLRSLVRQRRVLVLLLASWAPFLIRAVQIYLSLSFDQFRFIALTPQTFGEFLVQQSLFVFLVSMVLGGLLADDRRAHALQVYLSKPITRVEYVAGKMVVLLAFLLGITLLPALVLLLLQMLLTASVSFVTRNLFVLPAILLFSLLQSLVAGFVLLAVSAMSSNRRFVAAIYAGLVFFPMALVLILRLITGSRAIAWLSPRDALAAIEAAVFRSTEPAAVPLWAGVLVVGVLISGSIVILERRVRPVDIIR